MLQTLKGITCLESLCPAANACSSPDVSMPLMSDLSFSVAEKEKPG